MRVEKAVIKYLESLAVQGYADGTIRNRRMYLDQFSRFLQTHGVCDLDQLTKEMLLSYRVKLSQQQITPLSLRDKVLALRCLFAFLYRQGIILYDLSAYLPLPKIRSYLPKDVLTQQEVEYFLSLPNVNTKRGLRDRAMLELLYAAGIRRGELCGLELYDINFTEGTIIVTGKGRKQRMVPAGANAMKWIGAYIQNGRDPLTPRERAVFLGLASKSRLTPKMLGIIVRDYARASGIPKHITPHTFRHTFATHMIKNGADIRYVQKMLGHARMQTTQLYTRVVIADLKVVYQNTHPRAKKK